MSSKALKPDAEYGRLPFDVFLSERWSDNNTTEANREKWERLVWEWDSLTLLERHPYQQRAESESAPPLSEHIKTVLATHQTTNERNISLVSRNGWQTVWLRTCYDPGLEGKYKEMELESEVIGWGSCEDDNKVLDDATRYNFDDGSKDSWRRVLVCVPGITDFHGVIDMDGDGSNIQYVSGQDDKEMIASAEDGEERWRDVSLAQLKIQAGLYLLDREAIESGLIKILWLDEHGQIAWENRMDPFKSDLSRLAGSLMMAISLVELAGYSGTRGALIEN